MGNRHLHFINLFKDFAIHRQNCLTKGYGKIPNPENGLLKQLLSRYDLNQDVALLQEALLDPYIPFDMLVRTIFADVTGMRFYINKRRPDLEPDLAAELLSFARAFLQIREDIETLLDPQNVTCIPLDGKKHRLPNDQWCRLCGTCCQIGGIPPNPPPGIHYPDHWYDLLSGQSVDNQQLCPFLFQYFGEPVFFCAIHHIKPIACRTFNQEDCQERRVEKNLHA